MFHPVNNLFDSVQVSGMGNAAQLNPDGGTIVLRGLLPINLKTFFDPRKTRKSRKSRKSRNKSISYINSARHPSGESINKDMYLNLSVFIRVVRGQQLFLG
jgi:hypothetical protein